MSGFGVREPTHVGFSVVFTEETPSNQIALITQQLVEDGWGVDYVADKRYMSASKKIEPIKPPKIIQGPADPVYMAKKAWAAYVEAVGGTSFEDKPLPSWDELGERQQAGWLAAAKALLPK